MWGEAGGETGRETGRQGDTHFLWRLMMTECLIPSPNDPPSAFITVSVCVAPPTSPSSASTAPEDRCTTRRRCSRPTEQHVSQSANQRPTPGRPSPSHLSVVSLVAQHGQENP